MSLQNPTSLYPHFKPSPGTATPGSQPKSALFNPLHVRGLHLQNRIAVSPMGTFSAVNGHMTDFHLVHLGSYALKGAALVIAEATAVAPNGRVSTGDSGLWADSQIPPLTRVVDFVHSQGQKIDIHPHYQVDLAHNIRDAIRADGIKLLIAAVGCIDNAEMAESIVAGKNRKADQQSDAVNGNSVQNARREPQADLVLVGKEFLRDTEFVLNAAKSLDVKVQWPVQYLKGYK